jgi:hypothetical protein
VPTYEPYLEADRRISIHPTTTPRDVIFPSLRAYLFSTNSQSALILENTHAVPLQRIGDFHPMDRVLECNQLTPRKIRIINYCRLFLQVHTVADLATAAGTHVDHCFLNGQVSLLSSTYNDLEIHQERPCTPEAWNEWRKACSLWCSIDTGTSPSVPGIHHERPCTPEAWNEWRKA